MTMVSKAASNKTRMYFLENIALSPVTAQSTAQKYTSHESSDCETMNDRSMRSRAPLFAIQTMLHHENYLQNNEKGNQTPRRDLVENPSFVDKKCVQHNRKWIIH
jgi:hypothetical protein